ncbi:helix-turn-helix domain-containing protein [Formosa undariae]|uniref:Helix-turn-helix domain-containing protein n=1 Tax=Formosa undariae TaxID=1325436 RepID=A0ABV5F0T6_9FLAO
MPQYHFLVNSTLILVGIIGLFVISLLLFSYRSNIFVNIYLVIIFTLCSIRTITIGFFEIIDTQSIFTSRYILPIYIIAVPSLYLYFKSLIKDYNYFNKNQFLHFLYPVFILIFSLAQEHFPTLKNQSIENSLFIGLNVFVFAYWLLSFNILYTKLWNLDVSNSLEKRHYLVIKNWTQFIFIISSFLFIRILFSIYYEKNSNELFRAEHYSALVIIPWFLIYGKILIHPEILYGYPDMKKRDIDAENQININDHVWIFNSIDVINLKDHKDDNNVEEKALSYVSNIEYFVNKKHPFRNPNFSMNDFVKAINIPKSHLCYIFKYHAIVTFEEYINYCRIKDALRLIEEGYFDNITVEELSKKVGFNSCNLFLIAFRKQTKLEPKDFLNGQNTFSLQNADSYCV